MSCDYESSTEVEVIPEVQPQSWPLKCLGFSYVSWRQNIGLFVKEKTTA